MSTPSKKAQQLRARQEALEKELIGNLVLSNGEGVIGIMQYLTLDDFSFYQKEISSIQNAKLSGGNFLLDLNASDFTSSFSFLRDVKKISEEIKEIANAVRIYSIFENAMESVPESNVGAFMSEIHNKLIKSVEIKEREESTADKIIENYKKQQEFYKEKFLLGNGIIGISTGFSNLDDLIDGFRPGHLWVIGGYTNMGKTQAALNLVASLVTQRKRTVVYSLEMSKDDIISRLTGIMTNQNGLKIYKNYSHDVTKVQKAFSEIVKSKLSIYNEKLSINEIQLSMVEEMIRNPVNLFVIDFIQLVQVPGARSEYETITASILEIQKISKKLGVPILVLSQISNEGAKGLNDNVMTFKGSGAIAAAADIAIELKSNESDAGTARQKMNNGEPVAISWMVRKNRHGRVGTLPMIFNSHTGVFTYDDADNF